MNKDQQRLLTRAKLKMLRQLPYYGTYCIGIDHIEDYGIPTACTNGTAFRLNPFWVLGGETRGGITHDLRPVEQVVRIEAHEVLHNTFKHMIRFGWRHMALANVAADHAVNLILEDGKVGEQVQPWPEERETFHIYCDPRFRGMSFEKIYDVLEAEWKKQGGGLKFTYNGVIIDLSQPGVGDFEAPRDLTDAARSELERALDSALSSAAAAAKGQGKLPAELLKLISTALKPKINWRERLRAFVGRTMPSDYSWSRPHRRYLGSLDLYLPHVEMAGVGKILVIMDTSGSVAYDTPTSEGAQYFSEIKAIFEDCRPEALHVLYCDAAVAGHDVFMQGELPELRPRGGGGTDFRPPFDKIKTERIDIQCAIYLTDMYGTFPEKPPPYPVLWIATSDVVAPWGTTIRLEH